MIEINLNTDTITSALERAMRALPDLSPVMEDIGEYLRTSTLKRFAQGTAPDGSKWA